MDCCKNELGIFPHNKDIKTGLLTTDGVGNYLLTFTGINGTKFGLTITITDPITEPTLIIPKGTLNEDFYYCFTVYGPTDTFLTDANGCGTFCLRMYIEITPNCGDSCPPPPEEAGPLIPG